MNSSAVATFARTWGFRWLAHVLANVATVLRPLLAFLGLLAAAWQSPLSAESPGTNKELVEAWLKVSLSHAQDYVIHPLNAPDEPFQMLPQAAGLQWKVVPKAPLADKTAVGRQRQAREIARRFTAESIDHKAGRWELRLLAKPVHQFDVEQPAQVVGGSLNLFCQGTDPELILAVEAQKVNDEFVWHYAPASFTDYALKLQLDGQEVWTSPEFSTSPTGPHWSESVGAERLPKSNGATP